jgi:putative membrane protein insertion efficiency factor
MLKRLLIAPIRFYQRFLSPLKRTPSCRYLPTCSSYAIEAIERRGVVVGSFKALLRLLRCNPLFSGGYDPVERRIATCPCPDDDSSMHAHDTPKIVSA